MLTVKCITGPLDANNPTTTEWAKQNSARLLRDMSRTAQAAVRNAIHRSFAEHIPPRTAARLIRDAITLTEKQIDAVVNLHQKLLTANGQTVFAGKTAIRVPLNGLSASRVDRELERYADRLLSQRALSIARTETLNAATAGQQQLWREAAKRGDIDKSSKRVWITAQDERLCPLCAPMDGETVGIFEGFSLGDPPAHTNCRCTVGLLNA